MKCDNVEFVFFLNIYNVSILRRLIADTRFLINFVVASYQLENSNSYSQQQVHKINKKLKPTICIRNG